MTIPYAIALGIIQGLTEFLPVSSSAHLSLWQIIFDAEIGVSAVSLEILLHLATLCAVVTVYISDLLPLVPAFFTLTGKLCGIIFPNLTCKHKKKLKNTDTKIQLNRNERTVIFLIVATLPLVLLSPVKSKIEALYISPKIIGAALVANAVLLSVCDIYVKKRKIKTEMKIKNSITVGLFQCLALIPGISRSGSTTLGGIVSGLDTDEALRFSFLLSVPVILGANVLSIPELVRTPIPKSNILPFACAMAAALLSGIAAITLFRRFAEKRCFRFFAIYCAVIGIASLILI